MATAKTREKIVNAALTLAAERDWERVSLSDIAEQAGVTLTQLREAYDGRIDILADFMRRTDRTVLSGIDPEMAEESLRERLFDILFARLEALEPHKGAIAGLGRAARRDPLFAAELNRLLVTSMAWMLNAAGINASGPAGLVRAQGLAFIFARVLRTWLKDDDPGHARTMAALDKELRAGERTVMRIDRLASLLPGWGPSRHSGRGGRGANSPPRPEGGPRPAGVYGPND
ncbi:TetR family transcriptional regulator [Afifella pfennigii]|uniref:TetR family transcriptional regulator n=1 Tax=Afifella pfennigii TaxID=209897 RepID=UPI00068E039B|nr:TetR family transcriptional regulator [Afifella pfennigii]